MRRSESTIGAAGLLDMLYEEPLSTCKRAHEELEDSVAVSRRVSVSLCLSIFNRSRPVNLEGRAHSMLRPQSVMPGVLSFEPKYFENFS